MANCGYASVVVLLVLMVSAPAATVAVQPPAIGSAPHVSSAPVVENPPQQSSLSEPAGFLLGSGIALLIALLAWGEQIRAITRDTRELERDFLITTGLNRSQLSSLLRAKDDDDRLLALTHLMASGKLTNASQVEILPLFEQWRTRGSQLRTLQSSKYWLTVALTFVFLAAGTTAAFSPELIPIPLIFGLPALLVVLLLATVILAGREEQQLNALLMQMGEKV